MINNIFSLGVKISVRKKLSDCNTLKQAELTKTRDSELTQAIEKIVRKRALKGDKIVFRTDEEFARAGMKILEKYYATDSEKTWFLSLV
jgi:hypothetical protein